jgi:hypothetical protein
MAGVRDHTDAPMTANHVHSAVAGGHSYPRNLPTAAAVLSKAGSRNSVESKQKRPRGCDEGMPFQRAEMPIYLALWRGKHRFLPNLGIQ